MDLKIYNPDMFSATQEDLAELSKEQMLKIAETYKGEKMSRTYMTAEYKSPYEAKFRTTNFTWSSLSFIIKKGNTVENLRPLHTIVNKEEQIIGELPNELELQPMEVSQDSFEEDEAKEPSQCCDNPEDCTQAVCPEGKESKVIPIDKLEKEDIMPLLDARGVKYKKNFGVKRFRKLLKESENK